MTDFKVKVYTEPVEHIVSIDEKELVGMLPLQVGESLRLKVSDKLLETLDPPAFEFEVENI